MLNNQKMKQKTFKLLPLLLVSMLVLSGCSSNKKGTRVVKAKPSVRAKAAYIPTENSAYAVFDINEKKFLEGRNFDLVRPIASVTKLMTAVVFLDENKKKYCYTPILASDADFIKGTKTRLPKNVNIACGELFKAMLVRSDNYAAHALAHATHLTKPQFMAKMNQKARELGMTHTYFLDSSGLSPQNVSTVSDLAKLAAYAATKSEIQQIANQPAVTVFAGDKSFNMRNTNAIVRNQSFPALVSKTGYTREAGFNLAFVNRNNCDGKRIGVISLNNKSSAARTEFTEAMLSKYKCRRNFY